MNMEEMLAQAQKAAETIQKQMSDAQAKLDEIEVDINGFPREPIVDFLIVDLRISTY